MFISLSCSNAACAVMLLLLSYAATPAAYAAGMLLYAYHIIRCWVHVFLWCGKSVWKPTDISRFRKFIRIQCSSSDKQFAGFGCHGMKLQLIRESYGVTHTVIRSHTHHRFICFSILQKTFCEATKESHFALGEDIKKSFGQTSRYEKAEKPKAKPKATSKAKPKTKQSKRWNPSHRRL